MAVERLGGVFISSIVFFVMTYQPKTITLLCNADLANTDRIWRLFRTVVTLQDIINSTTECYECGQNDNRHTSHCVAVN